VERENLSRHLAISQRDVKGETQVEDPQGRDTDAGHRDGPPSNTDEVLVMRMERRGWASSQNEASQPGDWEERVSVCVGLRSRDLERIAGRNRMRREVQVRLCEGLRARFLRPT
jgi:hypothetical protein